MSAVNDQCKLWNVPRMTVNIDITMQKKIE